MAVEGARPTRAGHQERPLKVADVTEFWSERGGGVRSYLTTKAHQLTRLGVEHLVVASGPRDQSAVLASAGERRSELVRLKGRSLPYDPTYSLFTRFGALRERLLREQPDVLEIHSPQLAAAAGLSIPRCAFRVRTFVWHSDFIDTYLAWRLARLSSEAIAERILEPLWGWVRTVASRCAVTLAASAGQARKLRARGVPRVHELRFGVDTEVFHPNARDENLRKRFLGSRKALLCVSAGRLAGEKRWDVVIDGFRRLRARRDAVLLVLGDGPERAALMQRARDLPDVHFLGFDSDRMALARVMASADALVHAGPFETFGLAVAEAVACGTPVVVSTSGAARELAAPGCSEEYRWPAPEALSQAIERLAARDPVVVRARALDAARRTVSTEQHFRALLALYQDLLRSGPPAQAPKPAHGEGATPRDLP